MRISYVFIPTTIVIYTNVNKKKKRGENHIEKNLDNFQPYLIFRSFCFCLRKSKEEKNSCVKIHLSIVILFLCLSHFFHSHFEEKKKNSTKQTRRVHCSQVRIFFPTSFNQRRILNSIEAKILDSCVQHFSLLCAKDTEKRQKNKNNNKTERRR